jgi:hypothetical protein
LPRGTPCLSRSLDTVSRLIPPLAVTAAACVAAVTAFPTIASAVIPLLGLALLRGGLWNAIA